MTSERRTLVVCGGGLAGNLASLSLAHRLGQALDIVQVVDTDHRASDAFYGGATAPESHNFLHGLGLDESALMLRSQTSFSFGTVFRTWVSAQPFSLCHHAPFALPAGIPLRHFLTRSNRALEPLVISAQAARQGRFAHPPEDKRNPLSRAEYGYQFAPADWASLIDTLMAPMDIRRHHGAIRSIGRDGETGAITQLTLSSGEVVTGDLFIDASGPERQLIGALDSRFLATRTLGAREQTRASAQLGPACRVVNAQTHGWSVTTHLQDRLVDLHITAFDHQDAPSDHQAVTLGWLDQPWISNCVALGHAANTIEPLTPAPMMMLQRDIERLQELIPASADMSTERREFNRRFKDDVSQAKSFHDALYLTERAPPSPFWDSAVDKEGSPGLTRKITQFKNRGVLVSYDLEPFNEEDWTQNHLGMGRKPRQYDRQLETVPVHQAEQSLAQMQAGIEHMVTKMPPHALYLTRFKDYLMRQGHG